MPTSAEHYATHLAPVYLWMAGGFEAALEAGTRDIEFLAQIPADRTIVDLGTGFGMHAIPLAQRGFSVVAIDSSAELLRTLETHRGELPITTIEDDLLKFRQHLSWSPGAILCMGDTLTHLDSEISVDTLIREASLALEPGALLVLTFRDYSTPLTGDKRFIPVRSDNERILTCFLEYEDTQVKVHDVLHEHSVEGWRLSVSWYRKLRLTPASIVERLAANGFDVRQESGARGMVRLIARRL